MWSCLTKQSRFRRAYTFKKGIYAVANLVSSTFVLIAILISASAVNADPIASREDTAVTVATKSVPSTGLGQKNDSQTDIQEPIIVSDLNAESARQGAVIVAASTSDKVLSIQQSQQIIENLSETVERLSQQVSLKDQQIKRLEKQATTLWQWLLIFFIALGSSVYLMRARLYTKAQSLNLFRSNDLVELNGVAKQRSADVSIDHAAQNSAEDQETLESVPCQNVDGDDSPVADDALSIEAGVVIDNIDNIDNIDDLSFDQRFEQLLAEKDFAFARELLDFTRYNEINDERYHCERLRLLEKMQDEDGFYEYYYGIEAKIPTFPENLQTQISQLVVMLAQR